MKIVNDGTVKADDEISLQAEDDSGEAFGDPITLKKQK